MLIGVGVISLKKISNEQDFLVAGRRLGYGLYVPAMTTVVLGGASTFGSTTLGYQYGISGLWLVGMIGIGILGMGIFLSGKLSKLKVFSVSELLGDRFGKSSRYISGLIMTVYDIMVSVTAIVAIGVLCIIFGISGAVIRMVASVVVPGLSDPQQALPQLVLAVLPTGLIGILLAAVPSAVMSTASGTIMASSTIIVNDFILSRSKKNRSAKDIIKLTRVVTMVVGCIAIFISLVLQDIIVALDVAYALLSGSIFIPILVALFFKNVSAKVTLTAMTISAVVVIGDLIIEGVSSLNVIIYGLLACALVMIIGSLVQNRRITTVPQNENLETE